MENTQITDKKTTFLDRYIGTYDTPKKLNRSTKKVSEEIINKIESGDITSADLIELSSEFPIFTYKTCITIHGDFPNINREYIGGYKNLHQNKNGSIEIKHNAIDYLKKTEIANMISSFGWAWSRNSTQDHFYHCDTFNTREEAMKDLMEKKEVWAERHIQGMKCKISVQAWSYFGRYYVNVNVVPLSIDTKAVLLEVATSIAQVDSDVILKAYNQKMEEKRERQREYEESSKQMEEKRLQIAEAIEVKEKELAAVLTKTEIGIGTYIHVAKTISGIGYCQLKTEKASFGRVKAYTRYSLDKNQFTTEFKEMPKLMKPSEITKRKVFVWQ